MQWVGQATGQAGDRAAHLFHSGAVDRLADNDRRRASSIVDFGLLIESVALFVRRSRIADPQGVPMGRVSGAARLRVVLE